MMRRNMGDSEPTIHIEKVDRAEGADTVSAILQAISDAQDNDRI